MRRDRNSEHLRTSDQILARYCGAFPGHFRTVIVAGPDEILPERTSRCRWALPPGRRAGRHQRRRRTIDLFLELLPKHWNGVPFSLLTMAESASVLLEALVLLVRIEPVRLKIQATGNQITRAGTRSMTTHAKAQ